MGADIVLHQRGEQRLGDAEPDRAGGEVDVVGVLGARGIALRALVAAKVLELLPGLAAEQILDGVIDRARMRLDRDPILRTQRAEIERGHDGGERRRGGLMAADLQAVGALAQVIGVVDGPARKPQDLFFELAEDAKLVGARVRLFALGHRSRFNRSSGMTNVLMPCGSQKRAAIERPPTAPTARAGRRPADRPCEAGAGASTASATAWDGGRLR